MKMSRSRMILCSNPLKTSAIASSAWRVYAETSNSNTRS